MRKNFSLLISYNTKDIILNKKALLEEGANTDCKILAREANQLGKIIKKEIENKKDRIL